MDDYPLLQKDWRTMITGFENQEDSVSRFLIARHEIPANLDTETGLERFYGTKATNNPHLAVQGKRNMFKLGVATRGIRFDQVIASGLRRTQESAEEWNAGRQVLLRFLPGNLRRFEINEELNDADYSLLDGLLIDHEWYLLNQNGDRFVHINQIDPYAEPPLPVISEMYMNVMKQSAQSKPGGNFAFFLHSPVALLRYRLQYPNESFDRLTYQKCVDAECDLKRGDYICVSITSHSWHVKEILYNPTRERMLDFFGVPMWKRVIYSFFSQLPNLSNPGDIEQ